MTKSVGLSAPRNLARPPTCLCCFTFILPLHQILNHDTIARTPAREQQFFLPVEAAFSPRDSARLSNMRSLVPFRDINVHASSSNYAFTSPSSPSAQTLVVERPSGDLRLNDGALLGAKRVSSIAGILGIIKLRLGECVLVWRQRPC